jgi:hypothetical protein
MRDDLPAAMRVIVPHPLLIVLLPLGLLGLRVPGRGALAATLPLTLGAYAMYTFSVPYYLVVVAPAGAMLIAAAIEAAAACWPARRAFVCALLVPAVTGLCIVELPQFNRFIIDDMFRPTEPAQVAQALAHLPHRPAVVLFHYTPHKDNPHYEPVYTTDVAWPDDAAVIRAHDLGPRNVEIFRYFAQHQPQRAFYVYHRGENSLKFLGLAKDLANQ